MIAFVALLVLFVVAVVLMPLSVLRPIADGTATVAGAAIRAVGISNVVNSNSIFLSKRTLQIGRDCTGAQLIAVFAALVLTYPSSRRDKLWALGVGIPALLVFNMFRLVGAGFAAEYFPNYFDVIHDYVFQVLLALSVLFLWLLWVSRLRVNAK